VIVLEGSLEHDPEAVYPACTGGERAGPPEDCGGAEGYRALLEALADPAHPEHEAMTEWAGRDFDPERFDIEWVNELLEAVGQVEWIAAMFPMPEGLLAEAPEKPWLVAWLDTSEAVVIEHTVASDRGRYDVAVALLEKLYGECTSGELQRPDRIRVEDTALASRVSEALGDLVEVLVDDTPEVEGIRSELVESMAESWRIARAVSSYMSGGAEAADVEALFQAAARLYRSNP
jgi:hypothetical protein